MTRYTALLIALLSLPFHSVADSDDDADFDEALRSFGFTSGAAHQCIAEADRPGIEAEVRKAFSGIVRLFGSDYAFYYAAAFGAGSSMAIDTDRCEDYIASFRRGLGTRAE